MITFELSPEVLGRTQFAISPLAELTLSLRLLAEDLNGHPHAPWLRRVRRRLRSVDMELLRAVTPPGRYIATSLVESPLRSSREIEDQFAALAQIDPGLLAAELLEAYDGARLPDRVQELVDDGSAGVTRLVGVLRDYWEAALAPYWPRMRAILEDDTTHRLAGLLEGGLYELLEDLHPKVSIEGSRMHVDKPHFADTVHMAGGMTLTPSIFVWPYLIIGDVEACTYALVYPARGIGRVWERARSLDVHTEESLAALLGRSRASILARTGVPASTTELARELGQSAASVNEHLTVLRRTGLVSRRRVGRSVLYRQTPLAESILTGRSIGARANGASPNGDGT